MRLDLDQLRSIQSQLAEAVIVQNAFKLPLTRIAGIDLAFEKGLAVTACVVMQFPSLEPVGETTRVNEIHFPYIPTFLAFREAPPIIELMDTLTTRVDVFLINAHGLAHPLLIGCASHVGVVSGRPTIGVATSNLCGTYERKPMKKGEAIAMYIEERQVGWVFQSQNKSKPIFISPGHKVDLASCFAIVKRCIRGHKLPEPLWQAHCLANDKKRKATLPSIT